MTITGSSFLSSCALYAQDQTHEPLSNASRQLTLSASWPDFVKQATADGIESAVPGRSVLYVKVVRSELEQDIRARVKVYATGADETQSDTGGRGKTLLGSFSLFPAFSAETSQTVDAPTFAFNLEPYLSSLSSAEKQETILNDLVLTLELVPFESEADLARGQIEIMDAEIKWLTD